MILSQDFLDQTCIVDVRLQLAGVTTSVRVGAPPFTHSLLVRYLIFHSCVLLLECSCFSIISPTSCPLLTLTCSHRFQSSLLFKAKLLSFVLLVSCFESKLRSTAHSQAGPLPLWSPIDAQDAWCFEASLGSAAHDMQQHQGILNAAL